MKTLKIFSFLTLLMAFTNFAFAQQAKTESIPVSGNCGMCKSKIEKAAREAGAKDATWDVSAKVLTVSYNSTSTNTAKIQTAVAAAGYDTRDVKSTDEAYRKLHSCCQYERAATPNDTQKMECCKDGKCTKPGHDGKDCCVKDTPGMDCCKDGKCSKEGHDGKDCCKAAQ